MLEIGIQVPQLEGECVLAIDPRPALLEHLERLLVRSALAPDAGDLAIGCLDLWRGCDPGGGGALDTVDAVEHRVRAHAHLVPDRRFRVGCNEPVDVGQELLRSTRHGQDPLERDERTERLRIPVENRAQRLLGARKVTGPLQLHRSTQRAQLVGDLHRLLRQTAAAHDSLCARIRAAEQQHGSDAGGQQEHAGAVLHVSAAGLQSAPHD